MLVLSRKVGESLCIGNNVTVTVVRIGPGSVRIGIKAPPDAIIARDELLPGSGEAPTQPNLGNGLPKSAGPDEA